MNKRDKRVTRDMRLTMLKIHNDLKASRTPSRSAMPSGCLTCRS